MKLHPGPLTTLSDMVLGYIDLRSAPEQPLPCSRCLNSTENSTFFSLGTAKAKSMGNLRQKTWQQHACIVLYNPPCQHKCINRLYLIVNCENMTSISYKNKNM